MELNEQKIMAHLRSYSGLINIGSSISFSGTHPKTSDRVIITVSDYGLGTPDRFEVTAQIPNKDESHIENKGDSLDEAIRNMKWDWLYINERQDHT